MAIQLRPCMRSSTSLPSSTPPRPPPPPYIFLFCPGRWSRYVFIFVQAHGAVSFPAVECGPFFPLYIQKDRLLNAFLENGIPIPERIIKYSLGFDEPFSAPCWCLVSFEAPGKTDQILPTKCYRRKIFNRPRHPLAGLGSPSLSGSPACSLCPRRETRRWGTLSCCRFYSFTSSRASLAGSTRALSGCSS